MYTQKLNIARSIVIAVMLSMALLMVGRTEAQELMAPQVTGIERVDSDTIRLSGDAVVGTIVSIAGEVETVVTIDALNQRNWSADVNLSDRNGDGFIDLMLYSTNSTGAGEASPIREFSVNANLDTLTQFDGDVEEDEDSNGTNANANAGTVLGSFTADVMNVFAFVLPGIVF